MISAELEMEQENISHVYLIVKKIVLCGFYLGINAQTVLKSTV
jgi:hypothetical protein